MAKFNLIGKNPEQAKKYLTFWTIVNAGEEEREGANKHPPQRN